MNDPHAVLVKPKVNDYPARSICWAPYEVEIGEYLRDGENLFELELVNTLRNMLGPHHRPEGEPTVCFGQNAFTGGWEAERQEHIPNWYLDPPGKTWTSDYFFVNYGLGSGMTVEYREVVC